MVHKKYLKKGGKTFGPYYYESYRDGDSVKKIYIGDEEDYKEWKTKKPIEQPVISIGFTRVLFFISLILLLISIFIIFAATVNQTAFKKSFTGFAIDENVSDNSGSSGLIYARMEGEAITESIDTSSVDLEIKNPVTFGGQPVSDNKNKRMDFETPNGQIRLYFDLLNYSEFVENAANVVNPVIEEEATEEILVVENETEEPETVLVSNETINETSENQTIPDLNNSQTNETSFVENATQEISNQTSEIENQTQPSQETEQQTLPQEEQTPEENITSSDVSSEVITSSDVSSEVITSSDVSSEGQGITGNIIKTIGAPFKFIQSLISFTGRVVEDTTGNETTGQITETVSFTEVKDKVDNLSEQRLDNIAENSVVKSESFDINVTETPEESSRYKWGYKVKLKDLKFMAKIDISANESISQYDDYTLQIGNNLLSFQDLVDRGYIVKIDTPALEIPVNLSVVNGEIVVNESAPNETINNVAEIDNTNIIEQNLTEENITEPVVNVTVPENISEQSEENQTLEQEQPPASEKEIEKDEKQKQKEEEKTQKEEQKQENTAGITGNIIKIFGAPFKFIQSLISFTGRVVEDENTSDETVESPVVEQPQQELPVEPPAENLTEPSQEIEQPIQPEENNTNNTNQNISNISDGEINQTIEQPTQPVQTIEETPEETLKQNQTEIEIDALEEEFAEVKIPNIEYNYTVSVYIERDFGEYVDATETTEQTEETQTVNSIIAEESQSTSNITSELENNNTDNKTIESLNQSVGITGNAIAGSLSSDNESKAEDTDISNISNEISEEGESSIEGEANISEETLIPLVLGTDFEDSDGNGVISIGDIVYLDPTLTTITITSIGSNDLLVNVTAEQNFTHLEIDTSLAPYDSLVAYYPFDVHNNSVGKTYDYSSNNYDGTLYNMTFETTNCVYGNCYIFNRTYTRNYIDYGTSAGNIGTGNLSFSLWININDTPPNVKILAKRNYNDAYAGWGFSFASAVARNPLITIANGTATTQIYAGIQLTPNVWYHLVGVINRTGNCTWYYNGIKASSVNISVYVGQNLSNTYNLLAGATLYSVAGGTFNGSLDDVMIFNTTLTPAQITAIYNNQSARFKNPGQQTLKQTNITNGYNQVNLTTQFNAFFDSNISARLGAWDVSLGYNNSDMDSTANGLVSYWHFDEASWDGTAGEVVDAMGLNNGTGNGGVNTSSNGVYYRGGSFDGVDDYVAVTGGVVQNGGNITLCSWINFKNQAGAHREITSFLGASAVTGFGTATATAERMNVANSTVACSSGTYTFTQNIWNHYCGTYNGTTVSFYVDGVLKSNVSCSVVMQVDNWNFGRLEGSTQYFNGSLDDIQIFNRSLTSDEVKELYVKGRALWNYTEYQNLSTGGNAYSISTVTTNILPDFAHYVGNSSTNLFYSPNLGSTSTTPVSMNVSDTSYPRGINITYPVNNSNFNTNVSIGFNYTIANTTGDLISCYWNTNNGANNTLALCSANITINLSQGYNNITLFSNDGVDVESASVVNILADSVYPTLNISSPVNGSSYNNATPLFNVSSSENGLNGSIIPNLDNSLVSWWRMDDLNSSGDPTDYMNRNNGSNIGGAVQTDAGKMGKAFVFDGVNDYVNCGNVGIAANGNATLSGWFYFKQNASSKGSYNRLFGEDSDNLLYQHTANNYIYTAGNDYFAVRPSLNAWHHIVLIYFGNTSTAILYLDGISYPITIQTGASTIVALNNFRISDTVSFNGTIDDVMIFNRSLTSSEIVGLYNATRLSHTSISLADGNHTFSAYTQDLAGNVNTTNVTFSVETGSNITMCRNLTMADTVYTLQNNINTGATCFNISANNITIDFNGFNITDTSPSGSEYGVTTAYNQTTVKNGYIYGFGQGITSSGNNGNYTNMTVYSNSDFMVCPTCSAIYLTQNNNSVTNNNLTMRNTASGFPMINGQGIYVIDGNNTIIQNNMLSNNYGEDGGYGIYLSRSYNNTLTNNTANSNEGTSGSGIGIFLSLSPNNNLTNNTAINNTYGIYITSGSNNSIIQNSNFSLSTTYDVYLDSNSLNNSFINCSYTLSKESVASGSSLIRKWYYQAYVNDTSDRGYCGGAPEVICNPKPDRATCAQFSCVWISTNYVSNANVSAFNITGTLADFSGLMTNSTGWTNITIITEYVNNGARGYYSNYTMYATNSSYPTISHSYNVTLNTNNLNDLFTLDNIYPVVNITYPLNTTYTINVSNLNYTIIETNAGSCWYSNNSGAWNSTPVSAGVNWTDVISIEGSNTWTVYCNDTVNNVNSSSVTFTKDTVYPILTITYPANNSNFNSSSVSFNVSSNENLSWCGLSIDNDANVTMTLNSSLRGGNYTNSSIGDGNHNFTISCNDTVGNMNTTDRYFFLVDTIVPTIAINSPVNGSNYNNATQTVNATTNGNSLVLNLDNSLVSWWRMDDLNSTGTGVIDYMGINNGSAINGAVQTDAGKMGKGFGFDGVDNKITTESDFIGTSAVTICAWIYPIGWGGPSPSYGVIIDNGRIYFAVQGASSNNNLLFKSNFTATAIGSATSSISLNTWKHVCITRNSTGGNSTFYINGARSGTANQNSGMPVAGTTNVFIGGRNADDRCFNGTIDEVLIFNRILSSTEIVALYNATAPNYLYNFSSDGSHSVTAYSQDFAGNVNTTTNAFSVDSVVPILTITYPANNSNLNTSSVSFNVSSNENLSWCGLSIDNDANVTMTLNSSLRGGNYTNSSIGDGNHNFTISCNDTVGNMNTTDRYFFLADTVKPLISYANDTLNDSLRVWMSNIYVNVSVTETNIKNITFKLYNSSSSTTPINTTTYNLTIGIVYSINWTGLSGDDYKYNVTVYDLAGNTNSTATRTITLIASQENVSLNTGWNLMSLTFDNGSSSNGVGGLGARSLGVMSGGNTDRNVSIVEGWNLIGYSSTTALEIENSKFINSSGSEFNWTAAVAAGKLNGYATYYDSSSPTSGERKYKYAASADLSMDSTNLSGNKGYWIYANETGNLTLTSSGGAASGTTYSWSKLRFSNGTNELNITQAGNTTNGWMSPTLKYWNNGWKNIYGHDEMDPPDKENISSWEGVFVYSYKNNITLVRQN